MPSLTAPPPLGAGGRRVVDQPVVDGPQSFPFVWYELAAERMVGSLGAGPWLLEVDIRVHVFSQAPGWTKRKTIIAEAIRLRGRQGRGDRLVDVVSAARRDDHAAV